MSNIKRVTKMEECEVTGEYMANLLSLTPRRIRQLGKTGVMTKRPNGAYTYPSCVQEYANWLKRNQTPDKRQKKLELQCKKIEQDIRENQEVMRGEVEDACWSEVQEFLARYKRYILEMDLEPEQIEKMNGLLARAIRDVKKTAKKE